MNCNRFAKTMNNATMINTYTSDTRNIAKIKTTITTRILKFKLMIKISIVAHYAFFAVITFSNINFFTQINSIVIQHL